jgi:hypothetical protein
MKRTLLLAALASACYGSSLGLGNGSSAYELTEPVVCTDYCRSHWEQTIGGMDRTDSWFINVAITPGDVDYYPTFRVPAWEPCCIAPAPELPSYPGTPSTPVQPDPVPTPEPWNAPMLAVILTALLVLVPRCRRVR